MKKINIIIHAHAQRKRERERERVMAREGIYSRLHITYMRKILKGFVIYVKAESESTKHFIIRDGKKKSGDKSQFQR